MAITWQQVAAPDLTDTSRMLGQGAAGVATGLKTLADAFNPIREAAKVRQAETRDLNTLKEISLLDSLKDPNALQARLSQLTPEGLTQQYGADNIDLSKVLSHAQSALPNLQNQITTNQNFGTKQAEFEEQPAYNSIGEELAGATTLDQLDAIQQKFAGLNSKLGLDGTKAVEAKRQKLISERQTQEDRNRSLTKDNRQIGVTQAQDAAAKFYADIPDLLNVYTSGTELAQHMEDSPWFEKLPIAEQESLRDKVNSVFTAESSYIPTDMKAAIKKSNEAELTAANTEYTNKAKPLMDELEKASNTYTKLTGNGLGKREFSLLESAKSATGLKPSEISDLFGDQATGLLLEDTSEFSNDFNVGVERARAELVQTFKAPNSEELAAVKERALNYKRIKEPNATEKDLNPTDIDLAAQELINEYFNDGFLETTLKETGLYDPAGSDTGLDINKFKNNLVKNYKRVKQAKPYMDKLTLSLNELANKKQNAEILAEENKSKKVQEALKRR